ncbi:MAG: VCBS repeat-containing protein [Desulfobacterales bacterium]|nr:VCBS repeat-containing protein [Desulfobacterales bacterium]
MKLRITNIIIKFNAIVIILLTVFILPCDSLPAGNSARVLILPLNIYSEKDLTFLQNGISDMLSTRMAQEEKVIPISREETQQAIGDIAKPINAQTAVSLGVQLKADFVIFGSLTVFGESISTDIQFIDVQQNKPRVVFNRLGNSHSDVIRHISLFAEQINSEVFERKTFEYQTSPQKKDETSQSRLHPDTLIPTTENSNLTISNGATSSLWKSQNFKTPITGMSIGDVDGDGKKETVFISENTIFIYRYIEGRFEKVTEIEIEAYEKLLGVDVADINKNGKSEIFITNIIRKSRRLQSFVLEFSDTQFIRIETDLKWYFRVLNVPNRGQILLGQKKGMDQLFTGDVYEMAWRNGRYEPAQEQKLPKGINIYGFTYGDVLNTGQEKIVAFTNNDYLRIVEPNGSEEWKSNETYGGNAVFLEYPSDLIEKQEAGEPKMDHYYLPQRIHIVDVDHDGKKEVITVKNIDAAKRMLSRLRIFKSGYIACLTWDNVGLSQKWKTRDFSGYISDYAIVDMDDDGQYELVFSLVAKTGGLLTGETKSYIIISELNSESEGAIRQ